MSKLCIYQIFYDLATKQMLDTGFIPLDNSKNERPDWFEFWVIRNFLRNNALEEHAWYGFLSPNFQDKTGFDSDYVISFLRHYDSVGDVALFSSAWDQLAYFKNPWEQGEAWHPNIRELTQKFLDSTNRRIDLSALVTDSTSSVFSNYVIAKKKFWIEWKKIADDFFEFVESAGEYARDTTYGFSKTEYPMKTFIQERFATLILATKQFKVLTVDQSAVTPIFTPLFPDNGQTRRLLQVCDLLKRK